MWAENRNISPIMATIDVVRMSCHQSPAESGVTLNISPPKVTMSICPTTISNATNRNPLHFHIEQNADVPVAKALALNMFQNCNITKMVKKSDNS